MSCMRYIIHLGLIVIICISVAYGADETESNQTVSPQSGLLNPGPGMDDIHDIHDMIKISIDARVKQMMFYGIIGVILLILIVCIVYYLYKKRKNLKKMILTDPPDISALILLEEVKNLFLTDQKGYYYKLTGITKGYISRRYHVDALEKTTEELGSVIKDLKIDLNLKNQILSFFRECDPVKFAGQSVDKQKPVDDWLFIKEFIHKTKDEPDVNPDTGVKTA